MSETRPLEAAALALLGSSARSASLMGELSEADWDQILAWGWEHRFLPYLHYVLREADLLGSVPAAVRDRLSAAHRRSALRALTRQGDMIAVHRALAGAGIGHVFLKGAYLAQFAYPEPGLRPLRDLDVLVSKARALDAYAALQDAGFVRDPQYLGHAEAFLHGAKHLPRLISPVGGTALELHVQLTASTRARQQDYDLHTRRVIEGAISKPLANHALRFPAPEESLLHLCIHAVYEHRFDNGPLILPDLHWLIVSHAIDWQRLWAQAREQDATRGLALALGLLAEEWPASRPHLQTDTAVDTEVIRQAARLLFRSFEARADVSVLDDFSARTSPAAKLLHLLALAFPPPRDLARQHSLSPRSAAILLCYPIRWHRLLKQRLPDIVKTMRDERRRAEARSLTSVNSWLNGP